MQFSVNRLCGYVASDCEVLDTETLTHKYQAQISLIGIQFLWTRDCEDALYRSTTEPDAMDQTNQKNVQRLNDLIAINQQTDQQAADESRN